MTNKKSVRKNRWNKILSILLVLGLAFTLIPGMTFAEDPLASGGGGGTTTESGIELPDGEGVDVGSNGAETDETETDETETDETETDETETDETETDETETDETGAVKAPGMQGGMSTAGAGAYNHIVTLVVGTESEDFIVADGMAFTEPLTPIIPAGMSSFRGWYLEGASVSYDFSTLVYDDFTLYAQFSELFLVKFMSADDGFESEVPQVFHTADAASGGYATPPTANDAAVHVFNSATRVFTGNWLVDGAVFDFATMPVTANLTAVPQYAESHYVYFYSRGTQVDPQLIASGGLATVPTAPTRIGYDFRHWSASDGGAAFDFATTAINDQTILYAVWDAAMVSYEICYWIEAPGQELGLPADQYAYVYAFSRENQVAQSDTSVTVTEQQTIDWGDNDDALFRCAQYSHATTATVQGNGSTVINVYYILREVEIRFNLFPEGDCGYAMSVPVDAVDVNTVHMNWEGVDYDATSEDYVLTVKVGYKFKETDVPMVISGSGTSANIYKIHSRTIPTPDTEDDPANTETTETVFTFFGWFERAANTHRNHANLVTFTEEMLLHATTDPEGKYHLTYKAYWTDEQIYEFDALRYYSCIHEGAHDADCIEIEGVDSLGVAIPSGWYHLENAAHRFMATSSRMITTARPGLLAVTANVLHTGDNPNADPDPLMYFIEYDDFDGAPEYTPGEPLYLFYVRLDYQIDLMTQGGESMSSVTGVTYGKDLSVVMSAIPTPQRDGYAFAGWYTDAEYNSTLSETTMPAHNLVLFAKWTPTSLTATFLDKKGGTEVVSQGTAIDAYLRQPTVAEGGYEYGKLYASGVFLNWYWTLPGTTLDVQYSWETPVRDNVTLFANWKTSDFHLTYTLGAGTGSAPVDNTSYMFNVQAPVASADGITAPAGKIFAGWQVDGTGKLYYPGQTVKMSGDITLVPRFITLASKVDIIYNSNYGASPSQVVWKSQNSEVINLAPATTFSRAGYQFAGWSTNPADSIRNPLLSAGTSHTVTGDVTFYAIWFQGCTVTFDPNNGGASWTTTMNVGDPVIDPGTPTKPDPDATFLGWYDTTGTLWDFDTLVPGNMTLTAKWTFEVTYDQNYTGQPSPMYTQSVAGGARASSYAPTRAGYVLQGWYKQAATTSAFNFTTPITGSITVYAKWIKDKIVTFDATGATTPPSKTTANVPYPGTTVGNSNMPTDPGKTNYTFAGWYTQANGGGTRFTGTTNVPADVTVYAHFTPNTYTVTFDYDGATNPTTATTTRNVTAPTLQIGSNMPTDPTKTGWLFGGWYTQANGGGTQFSGTTDVSGNIRVYAYWQPYTYTVTFDAQAGSHAGGEAGTRQVVSPSTTVGNGNMPANPTLADSTFAGWYTQVTGGTQFLGTTPVTGDTRVYARYAENVYRVTFNYQGATTPTTATTERSVYSPDYTVGSGNMPGDPTKTGWLFGGWYTQPNGGGTKFESNTDIHADTTVYAYWAPYDYTVTFNPSGGTMPGGESGERHVVSPNNSVGNGNIPAGPTKADYTFAGWYTQPNGGGTKFIGTTPVSGNMEVYAHYTPKVYKVTYDKQTPGAKNDTREVTVPDFSVGNGNQPADPKRPGYVFGGWYTEPNGGGDAFTATSDVHVDTTVYAYWKTYAYTVIFDKQGGTGSSSDTYTRTVKSPSTTIGVGRLPIDPAKQNVLFGGWYTEPNGNGIRFFETTEVTGNMTVYAKWETYTMVTVTFNGNGATTQANPGTVSIMANTPMKSMPTPPARNGYTFSGWATESGSSFGVGTVVSEDMVVYAQWTASSYYSMYFNLNGGEGTPPQAQSLRAGDLVQSVGEPSRTGYTFAGWNTSPVGSGSSNWNFATNTMPNRDLTLFAQWTANPGMTIPEVPEPERPTGTLEVEEPTGLFANLGTIRVAGMEVPLQGGANCWALVNLVATAVSILTSIIAIASYISKKRREDEAEYAEEESNTDKGKLGFKLAAALISIALVVLFILTENITTPMVILDRWTIFMVAGMLVSIILVIFGRARKYNDEDVQAFRKSNAAAYR